MNNLNLLTLNCQKGYHPDFKDFMEKTLKSEKYDFLLLQEVTAPVVSIIIGCTSSYKILNSFDEELGENTHVCILYKEKFSVKDSIFISFAKTVLRSPVRGWGFIGGVFVLDGKECVIGSTHLHPGINFSVRLKELKLIKQKLLERTDSTLVVFGGDFNTGFPRELAVSKRILLPEFSRVTKRLGPTLDSRFTEIAPFILNKISVFLAKFGIGFTFRTDHMYVSTSMMTHADITCAILADRVSDHNPVELIATPYSRV